MNGQAGRLVLWSIILIGMVAGCADDPPKSTETLPSPSTRTPAPAATNTPPPTDGPPLNVQFIGAADLSDESKSSLADLIESIRAGVVQVTTSSGSASGFIITSDGLVVTNEHVVSGESSVGVWLTNGRRYDADVLERDATSDLALLRIEGGSFDAIAVGDPNTVRMGHEVLALGFPLADTIGTNLTVTRGIVSSTRMEDGVQLLQTDASLNPGNSGGPLVNRDGEVIGVNSSRIEETDSGRPVSNIGFAVSVSELERRLPTLGGQFASLGTPRPAPTPIPASDPTWTPAPTFTPEPTWTPTPANTPKPTATLTTPDQDIEDKIEQIKEAIALSVKNEYGGEGLVLSPCEHKLGNETDNVVAIVLCMGENDVTVTDQVKAITILVIATYDSVNSLVLYAGDIKEYGNTLYECISYDGGEPDCEVYESLTYLEVLGAMFEQSQFFNGYE